jgi:hypothetical protein
VVLALGREVPFDDVGRLGERRLDVTDLVDKRLAHVPGCREDQLRRVGSERLGRAEQAG